MNGPDAPEGTRTNSQRDRQAAGRICHREAFGDRVRELRRSLRLSQADLARRLGRANNGAVSRVECAKSPTIALDVLAGLIALAERSGRDANWLLGGLDLLAELSPRCAECRPASPAGDTTHDKRA